MHFLHFAGFVLVEVVLLYVLTCSMTQLRPRQGVIVYLSLIAGVGMAVLGAALGISPFLGGFAGISAGVALAYWIGLFHRIGKSRRLC